MTIKQPTLTDKQNNPDHSLSHRVFANDDASPVKSVVVDSAGRVGIVTDAPTAALHLPAGTAAAGTAPMKLAPGTLLTDPEAGVLEFDGTGIYLTPTNHRRFISFASDSIIATQTATTIAPTTLWTGITNANELKPYRVYTITGAGIFNNQGTGHHVTITVNFADTEIVGVTTLSNKYTADAVHISGYITIRTIGTSGTLSAFAEIISNDHVTQAVTESVEVNTEIVNNITIKAVFDQEHANNWFKLTQCWMAAAD